MGPSWYIDTSRDCANDGMVLVLPTSIFSTLCMATELLKAKRFRFSRLPISTFLRPLSVTLDVSDLSGVTLIAKQPVLEFALII